MDISTRKNIGRSTRAVIALFVFLSAFFSARVCAQVPTGNEAMALSGTDFSPSLHTDGLKSVPLNSTPLLLSANDANAFSSDFTGLDDGDHKHSIKCQKVTDLDFGRAFSGVSAGTVVMDPNTNISRKSTGGVVLDNRNMGHPAYLQLTIYNNTHCTTDDHCSNDDNECDRSEDDDDKTNDNHTGFERHGVWNSISLPSSSTLSLTVGGHTYTMTADTYTFIRTEGNFYIGATLHVGANQVAGVYTGTFTVTQACD